MNDIWRFSDNVIDDGVIVSTLAVRLQRDITHLLHVQIE